MAARWASGCAQNVYPLSYGTFSHLCPSTAHESAVPSALGQVAGRRAGRGPQAERPVDVRPGPVVVGDGGGGGEVVEGAAVHVAGLEAHDRRPGRARRQHAGQVVDVDRPLVVGRHRLDHVGAEAEEAEGAVDRGVALAVGDDPHRRSAGQAPALDVPTRQREHVVAGRGQRHRVGRLAAGHEPHRRRWPGGRAGRCSQPPATSSTTAAPGEVSTLNAGWSHPTASTSAAVAASSAPPTTNPK